MKSQSQSINSRFAKRSPMADQHKSITFFSTDQPFFTQHHSYFNAEEGGDVELHCLYKAFPAPTLVRWTKGGSTLHNNEKYKIDNDMTAHHDRTKLLIRNVDADDLTMYLCEVKVSISMINLQAGVKINIAFSRMNMV